MVRNLVVVRVISSGRIIMMVWAVENFWVEIWVEDCRVANSRAGMCILAWILSSSGKGFGGSSVCPEGLAPSLYSN